MNLSYTLNIPAANNNPSADQPIMQINANSIGAWVNIDHFGFGFNQGGQHRQTTLITQASLPLNRTVDMGTLYTKQVSSASQLFYSQDATGNEYQLTRSINSRYALFGLLTQNYNASGNEFFGGWTFLPGGMLLQYGYVDTSIANLSTYTIPFPVQFNTAASIIIDLTAETNSNADARVLIQDGSVGQTQFMTFNTGSSNLKKINWKALGV